MNSKFQPFSSYPPKYKYDPDKGKNKIKHNFLKSAKREEEKNITGEELELKVEVRIRKEKKNLRHG